MALQEQLLEQLQDDLEQKLQAMQPMGKLQEQLSEKLQVQLCETQVDWFPLRVLDLQSNCTCWEQKVEQRVATGSVTSSNALQVDHLKWMLCS